jgi:hypothetical protein
LSHPPPLAAAFESRKALSPGETAMASTFVFEQLPLDVVGAVGTSQTLSSILTAALGPNSGGYSEYWIAYDGASYLQSNDFNYWNTSDPVVSSLSDAGVDIGASTDADFNQKLITAANLSSCTLNIGNDIAPYIFVTVPVSTGSGTPTVYVQYEINVVAPGLQSSTAADGTPTPADIVASAERFAALYSGVLNDNDCANVADDVAAAAGATLDNELSGSTDPAENESAGFWRVVYRGSDPDPVTDWQTLVQPGDIVRMAWTAGGEHTTTVLSVNADGTITVFDNADSNSAGQEDIGIHTANYDLLTIASSVTIFRLASDDLYLINGVDNEILKGSLYNNEFDAVSGDVVDCGPGSDVVNVGSGTITINGGGGADTAVFAEDFANYALSQPDDALTVASSGNTDTLSNVYILQFADGEYVFGSAAPADFFGTGSSDLLFENTAGVYAMWQTNGASVVGGGNVGSPGTGWSELGTGDFATADGDILFSDAGTYALWSMNGTAITASATFGSPGPGWTFKAIGDFYGNGNGDILFENTSGTYAMWETNGSAVIGGGNVGSPGAGWSEIGVGDFNTGVKSDILFESTGGSYALWDMNGTSVVSVMTLGSPGSGWTFEGIGNFDGSGDGDILFRGSSGTYAIWETNGGAVIGGGNIGSPGSGWSFAGIGDFNGDGKSDILFESSGGAYAAWEMNGTSVAHVATFGGPGAGWTLQQAG